MNEYEETKYSKREADDRELARRLDLEYLERMIGSMRRKKRNKKIAVVGPRAFSAQDVLEEIRSDGPHAETLRAMLRDIRLAKLREGKQ